MVMWEGKARGGSAHPKGAIARGAIAIALAAVAMAAAWAPPARSAQAASVAASASVAGEPAHSELLLAPPGQRRVVPLFGAKRSVYAQQKREAARRAASGRQGVSTSAGAAVSRPLAAVVGSLNQPGVSAQEQIATLGLKGDVTPPDTTGAIGPEHYVEFVNSEIVAYARADLKRVGEAKDITEFVGDKKSQGDACDPQIKYDPQASRWFYVAIECGRIEKENALYVGFSKTSNPADLSTATGHGWCGYAYSFGTEFQDYPKLGLDSQHIIVGTNGFVIKPTSEAFPTAHILSLPKPASGTITTCPAAATMTVFGSKTNPLKTSVSEHKATTPEPATVADSSPGGFVVSADQSKPFEGTGKNIMIWQLAGTAAAPELKALGAPTVSSFSLPANVPQPGSTDRIDSLDARLTQAVAAADPNAAGAEAVWTQHTVAGGAGSVVRWYELVPGKLEVRQAGTISDASLYVFNGAIAPTLSGGAVINYNTGSSSEQVKIMAQSRTGSDPAGQMNGPIVLGSSSARDADFSCPSIEPFDESCRWGDYAGASVDPTNGNVVWGSNQADGPITSGHDAQWTTRNFALQASDVSPTASFRVSANPIAGAPVDFDASASNDPDGTIESYKWQFGDGGEGTGKTVSHTYAAGGKYTVKLTVEDNAKLTGSAEQTVTVKNVQTITFTSTPPSDAAVGGPTYNVKAEATSGLPVSFSSGTPSVCSVSSSTVSFVGAGECTVLADQSGNSEYAPAPQQHQTFPVTNSTPPSVTKLKPNKGPVGGGTTVIVTGSNFSGASAVAFGAIGASSFTVNSSTQITAVAPAEPAGIVDLRVTTTGGTSAVTTADRYKFSPTITSVSPTSGSTAGGTSVTVKGTGFAVGTTGTKFKFGTTKATSVDCTSSTTCTVVSPAHAAETVDVRATVNKVTSPKTSADRFTYA